MTAHRFLLGNYFPLLFLLLFGSINFVLGQEDYKDGYVVTVKNDTLFGRVSDRKLGPFGGGIHEKIKLKGKRLKKRFSPKDVRSYKKGDSIYRSLFLDGEYQFLRVVSEGTVSYYAYELQEQGEQMVLDVAYLRKENSRSLIRADQGIFGLKRKRLSMFFADCPPLVLKIQNKELKYVFEVVNFYNEWKENQKTY
jgi:hypothetical protein